jgi:hypothetical protein
MATLTSLRKAAKGAGISGAYKMSRAEILRYIDEPGCPPSKVMNPETYRCVARKGVAGRYILGTECRADQYLNTATNRCVTKTGRKGKRMDRARDPRYMLNPVTGRYVLKTGATGRELRGLPPLKKKRKTPPKPPRGPKPY